MAAAMVGLAVSSHAGRPGSLGAGNPPPAPGTPRFVQIESFEGLPRDSMERQSVLSGFRGAFAASELLVERPGAGNGAWLPEGRMASRFRWLEGEAADSVWTVQVVFGFPRELPRDVLAPRPRGERAVRSRPRGTRAARGFNLVLAPLSPEARFAGARPMPVRWSVAFPPDTTVDYPWSLAGLAAGRLALEALHHASGDLPAASRIVLERATRAPSP